MSLRRITTLQNFKGDFLTGDNVTIADIAIAASLDVPTMLSISYEKYEKITGIIKKTIYSV